MKNINKSINERYFYVKNVFIGCCFAIWALVSFGCVSIAERLVDITVLGMPLHYYMGAQGAILVFIALLFANAIISDKIDKKFSCLEE
ncbi:MAG: sodium/substrate symporter small subunit [Bacillota bacterium]